MNTDRANASPGMRLVLSALLAGPLLLAPGGAQGMEPVQCTLADDSTIRLAHDPGHGWPATLQACRGDSSAPPPADPPRQHTGSMSRFRCAFHDGRTVTAGSDLRQFFPDLIRQCEVEAVRWEAVAAVHSVAPRSNEPRRLLKSLALAAPLANPANARIDSLVRIHSERHGIDPLLVAAVVHAESGGAANARSPKGALGLMQVMPATGQRYGVAPAGDLTDPAVNIGTGVRYLRDLLDLFDGRTDLALAAYNAGEGAVMRHGRRIPPYPETQSYVSKVLLRYGELMAARSAGR